MTLYRGGLRAVFDRLQRRMALFKSRSSRFTDIAEAGGFGDSPSLSGVGSTLEATEAVRDLLPKLIERYNITSFLDIPCGDFYWMQYVDLKNVEYIGADIVESIIAENNSKFGQPNRRFIVSDLCVDNLPRVDLVLSRDCLIHLKLSEIKTALRNLKSSGSRLFLLSTYPAVLVNPEIDPRFCRNVNLEMPPFNLPKPIELFYEGGGCNEGKALGLWRNSDLPGGRR
ncbi:MAG: class I SAM-dependent methyltransferase [Thermodesulfovibrionales bacterium]